MVSERVRRLLIGLAGILLAGQIYHWLQKEWSTAILSGDEEVAGEKERNDSTDEDQTHETTLPADTSHNQFGAPGPILP